MPFLFTVHKNEKKKKLTAVHTRMTTTRTKQKPELKTNKTQEHQEKKERKQNDEKKTKSGNAFTSSH
jgi:hypothetical protein